MIIIRASRGNPIIQEIQQLRHSRALSFDGEIEEIDRDQE